MRLNNMLSPLAIKIGASALAIVAAFGLGWKICSWKNDSAYKAALNSIQKQYNEQLAQYKSDSEKRLEDINKQLIQIGSINAKLKTEIKSAPVYHECVLPDSGMQLRSNSISSANKVPTTK